jgi:hypothetical protein
MTLMPLHLITVKGEEERLPSITATKKGTMEKDISQLECRMNIPV